MFPIPINIYLWGPPNIFQPPNIYLTHAVSLDFLAIPYNFSDFFDVVVCASLEFTMEPRIHNPSGSAS